MKFRVWSMVLGIVIGILIGAGAAYGVSEAWDQVATGSTDMRQGAAPEIGIGEEIELPVLESMTSMSGHEEPPLEAIFCVTRVVVSGNPEEVGLWYDPNRGPAFAWVYMSIKNISHKGAWVRFRGELRAGEDIYTNYGCSGYFDLLPGEQTEIWFGYAITQGAKPTEFVVRSPDWQVLAIVKLQSN